MADFKQVDAARRVLGLGDEATLAEIQGAYRALILEYHPDRCAHGDRKAHEEKFKEITRAKELLLAYCLKYRYSFREKDVRANTLDRETYEHLRRFYDGLFGDLGL